MSDLTPIADGLWTDGDAPSLIAGQHPNGKIVFPLPEGDVGEEFSRITLAREGFLWSWTRQDFRPKSPYDGPEEFEPYLIGYIELPDQVIVESRIVGAKLEDMKLGLPMEFVIAPFDENRATYAFQPKGSK